MQWFNVESQPHARQSDGPRSLELGNEVRTDASAGPDVIDKSIEQSGSVSTSSQQMARRCPIVRQIAESDSARMSH